MGFGGRDAAKEGAMDGAGTAGLEAGGSLRHPAESGVPNGGAANGGAAARAADRELRRRTTAASLAAKEIADEIAALRARSDLRPGYEYFLGLLERDGAGLPAGLDRPVAAFLCKAAPLELLHAHGLHPFRLQGGCSSAAGLAAPNLPAVMCPMLRSLLGSLMAARDAVGPACLIVPSMCDWTVKFGSLATLCGLGPAETGPPGRGGAGRGDGVPGPDGRLPDGHGPDGRGTGGRGPGGIGKGLRGPGLPGGFPQPFGPVHLMDPPRVRNAKGAGDRWLAENRRLDAFLSSVSGRKIKAADLAASMEAYALAYLAFSDLIGLKRRSLLPQIWFQVAAAAFHHAPVGDWTRAAAELAADIRREGAGSGTAGAGSPGSNRKGAGGSGSKASGARKVLLAGSPVFFPNLKIPRLLEEASLEVVVDDMCSSERLLPGPAEIVDRSRDGLMAALSQRYQAGCLCPTFADHHHAVNNLLNLFLDRAFGGVVFHVLKGCHLFDLKSLAVEPHVKGMGLRYLRIETDYSREDLNTVLTRLEAFRGTLG